jgi:hypothetical protein
MLVGIALLLPASAIAAAPHPLIGNFGSLAAGGTGSEPKFANPAGMAVDQATGDVLAIEFIPGPGASGTIHRYKPDGTADNFSGLGTNVIDGKKGPGGKPCAEEPASCDETEGNKGILSNEGSGSETEIAVAPSTAAAGTAGNIYATDAENGWVDVFSSAGKFLTHFSGGGTYPCGVAVAPNGNVFVGDFLSNKVFKLVPTGPSAYEAKGGFSTPEPCQVAATEGFVFAGKFEGATTKIDSEGAEEGVTKYTVDSGSTFSLSADPSSGHLYIGGATELKEYDVSGASSASLIEPSIKPGNIVDGVAVNGTSGNVYVRRVGNEKIEVYGPRAAPKLKLNLSATGGEGGTFECKVGAVTGPCEAEYAEGTVVEVIAKPNEGSVFKEWTGDCTGSGACVVTMSKERSVVAHFILASESFEVEQIGSHGTVKCEDNGGGLTACAASYLYGHTIKVVATPESSEFALSNLTGTGSAAGHCNKGTGVCEFAIKAASKVTAEFTSAGTKDEATGNVHGEVPATTTLESECGDVNLGLFLPGVSQNYEQTCLVTATSTGAETQLRAADEGAHQGFLENTNSGGPYYLANALETKATGSYAALTSPVTLLTYLAPVTKETVTVHFKQHIGEHDPLRTGVYAKTITLTLEQTHP